MKGQQEPPFGVQHFGQIISQSSGSRVSHPLKWRKRTVILRSDVGADEGGGGRLHDLDDSWNPSRAYAKRASRSTLYHSLVAMDVASRTRFKLDMHCSSTEGARM
jgi:hypothetical protein